MSLHVTTGILLNAHYDQDLGNMVKCAGEIAHLYVYVCMSMLLCLSMKI